MEGAVERVQPVKPVMERQKESRSTVCQVRVATLPHSFSADTDWIQTTAVRDSAQEGWIPAPRRMLESSASSFLPLGCDSNFAPPE